MILNALSYVISRTYSSNRLVALQRVQVNILWGGGRLCSKRTCGNIVLFRSVVQLAGSSQHSFRVCLADVRSFVACARVYDAACRVVFRHSRWGGMQHSALSPIMHERHRSSIPGQHGPVSFEVARSSPILGQVLANIQVDMAHIWANAGQMRCRKLTTRRRRIWCDFNLTRSAKSCAASSIIDVHPNSANVWPMTNLARNRPTSRHSGGCRMLRRSAGDLRNGRDDVGMDVWLTKHLSSLFRRWHTCSGL